MAAALRQAVRLRTGQDVASDPDDLGRVFVDTLAFVRSYRPRSQEITADGGYRLELVAQVDDQPENLSDAELFDKLLARRPAPRVRLRFLAAEGDTEVLPSNELVAEIHELMRAYHVLQITPREHVTPRPTVDPVTGVTVPAENLPWQELDPAYDFGLDVRVIAAVQDPNRPAHEAPVLPKVELDLTWALTAERVGQACLPSTEVQRQSFITGNPKRESVERHARQDLLDERGQEAVRFCRGLLARWITECDLGTPVRLEFAEADSLALGDLLRALRRHPEIGYVTQPQTDKKSRVVLEAESRMNPGQLARLVLDTFPHHRLGEYSRIYLQFVPLPPPPPVARAIPPAAPPVPPELGVPWWVWVIMGVIIALILYVALRRRRRPEPADPAAPASGPGSE